MNIKTMAAAMLMSFGAATAASAAEGNNEPFPLSISIGANDETGFSTLPDANGLPVGALNGTPFYSQAQSAARWYAQQADHRFAQQRAVQARHG